MATKVEDAKKMVKVERETNRTIQVGLTLRYTKIMETLIEIIRRGDIGEVRFASATETLEGGGHFARWHRKKEYSGGILLQKGVHTIDLLNWIINEKPERVAGFGSRDIFKAKEGYEGRRCLTCPEKYSCSEYRDVSKARGGFYKKFYIEGEKVNGYIVDRCVYDPEADIMDNATLIIEYKNRKRANYNLFLFGAEPDRKFTVIGERGKIEMSFKKREIVLYKRRTEDIVKYEFGVDIGGHEGGDNREIDSFLNVIRRGKRPLADSKAGLLSVLVGVAGERTIEEGKVINLSGL